MPELIDDLRSGRSHHAGRIAHSAASAKLERSSQRSAEFIGDWSAGLHPDLQRYIAALCTTLRDVTVVSTLQLAC